MQGINQEVTKAVSLVNNGDKLSRCILSSRETTGLNPFMLSGLFYLNALNWSISS